MKESAKLARVPTPKAEHHPDCLKGRCVCNIEATQDLLNEWWENHHLDVADDIGLDFDQVSDRNAEVFP